MTTDNKEPLNIQIQPNIAAYYDNQLNTLIKMLIGSIKFSDKLLKSSDKLLNEKFNNLSDDFMTRLANLTAEKLADKINQYLDSKQVIVKL
jgi:hypothetical protein